MSRLRSFPAGYALWLAVAFLFGLAVSIHHGRWDILAFAPLVLACVAAAALWASAVRSPGEEKRAGLRAEPRAVWGVVVFALLLACPIIALLDKTVIPEAAEARWTVGRITQWLSLALLFSYLPSLMGRFSESTRFKSARFALFGALVVIGGASAIAVDKAPDIDVWTIQQRGVSVLLEGKNPYTWATVPDTDPEATFTVPYVYPPTSIYVGVLGHLIGGDVRHALLLTIVVTGLALRFIARRSPPGTSAAPVPALIEDAPALFFWLTPPMFFVLDRAWIDPVQVALICLAIAAYVADRRTASAVLLGLASSSKQSMFWLILLAWLLYRTELRRWVVFGISALVPVLPFIVWNFHDLKYANFDFMTQLSARTDGLCFTSWVHHAFGLSFPTQLAFLMSAAVVGMSCLRTPAEPAVRQRLAALDFSRAVTLTYFVFFFFNRWAFANYYFLLTGLAALTAATTLQAHRAGQGA